MKPARKSFPLPLTLALLLAGCGDPEPIAPPTDFVGRATPRRAVGRAPAPQVNRPSRPVDRGEEPAERVLPEPDQQASAPAIDAEQKQKPRVEPDQVKPPEPDAITAEDAGDFVVSLCRDDRDRVWVGTEDHGVLCHDPGTGQASGTQTRPAESAWTQYTTADGLGDDNAYALCRDSQGRIWVGHQSHGVSVWNGESWRNFGVLDGPLGERVFDIACCPNDGDVWFATNCGLARYNEEAEPHWRYYTRAGTFPPIRNPQGGGGRDAPGVGVAQQQEGAPSVPNSSKTSQFPSLPKKKDEKDENARPSALPSNQIEALAFAPDGTLFAGTQCHGLAIASPEDNYTNWRHIPGGMTDEEELRPTGSGLPSGQINDVLVHSSGTLYVATTRGLAISQFSVLDDSPAIGLKYLRGRDYDEKVKNRWEPVPNSWRPIPKRAMRRLLPEDYVTSLAEGPNGKLWIGFRREGLLIFDPKTKQRKRFTTKSGDLRTNYVTALLPSAKGIPFIGTYGGGLSRFNKWIAAPSSTIDASHEPQSIPPLPKPARAPTAAQLKRLTKRVKSLNDDEKLPETWGTYFGADWRTKGDWVGRYGRQYALLCAMDSPLNDYVSFNEFYRVRAHIGPHHHKGDRLRYWVHKIRWDDPRVLYNPTIGYRRQADWDDHGEAYPMSYEGPDVWVGVEVPEGLHRIALYFFNKDGHTGSNRFRDFLLELKPYHDTPGDAENAPTLAKARVKDFWGGVHQCFVVHGPGKYLIKIGRNNSFNTIVSGVFCDSLAGFDWPYDHMSLPWMGNLYYRPPQRVQSAELLALMERPIAAAAAGLWAASKGALWREDGAERLHVARLLAYRAALAAEAPPELLARWKWKLRLWTPEERAEFEEMMKRAWQGMCEMNPHLRKINDPETSS